MVLRKSPRLWHFHVSATRTPGETLGEVCQPQKSSEIFLLWQLFIKLKPNISASLHKPQTGLPFPSFSYLHPISILSIMMFRRLAVAAGGCGDCPIGHVFAESSVDLMLWRRQAGRQTNNQRRHCGPRKGIKLTTTRRNFRSYWGTLNVDMTC